MSVSPGWGSITDAARYVKLAERFDRFCQRHPSVALGIFAVCALASMVVA